MSLEQTETIDIIFQSKVDDRKVVLVISDSGATSNPEERLQLLTKKLSYYFNVIIGNSFKEKYPRTTLSDVTIQVMSLTPPSKKMLRLSGLTLPTSPDLPQSERTARSIGNTVKVEYLQTNRRPWTIDQVMGFEKTVYTKS